MLDELVTAYGNRFLVAALGVSLALLCLFIVLRLLRNRAPSPFVRGGRNRQPRLQVLDAAAIDARRRLVLVRRDNVEHLVMIGGPTDIVIESGIGDERAYISAVPVPASVESAETEARIAPQAEPQRILPQEQPVTAAEPARKPTPAELPQAQPARSEPVVAARPQPQQPVRPPAPRPEPVAPATAAALTEEVAAPAQKPQATVTPAMATPVAEAPQVQPVHAEPAAAASSTQANPAAAYVPVAAPVPPAPAAQATLPAAPAVQPEQAAVRISNPVIHAEDVLEAARQRVLAPSVESPAAANAKPSQADEQHSKKELSDFERVLEEEMALHLSANEAAARTQFDVAPIVPDIRPSRPVSPPVIVTPPPGAPTAPNREEPNLQTEIARIFGEMSVNRNN